MTAARVVVVGGGISGLRAAHALATTQPSIEVTVLEAADRVGGKLATHRVDGLTLDAGAESVLARRPEAVRLIDEVGLGSNLVHPATSGAAVWVDGQLHPLPRQQLLGIPGDVEEVAASGVLDESGLAALGQDRLLPPPSVDGDVSVGSLVRSRMGDQVLDRLVEPLLGGVYAGTADQISADMALPGLIQAAQRQPSLMAAVQSLRTQASGPVFASIRGGLGRLPGAVVASANLVVRTGTTARALDAVAGGWVVTAEDAESHHELPADAVVLACPAAAAAQLVRPHVGAAATTLEIDYASVVLVTFVFRDAQRPTLPPGTGFLVPPSSGRLLKAGTYSSQKWGWLAQEHPEATVVRVSMGRFGDEGLIERTDDALAEVALTELQQVVATTSRPDARQVTRWTRSLPQYRVGHRARITLLREALTGYPGLEICGAAVDGVGIPSCLASAEAAATRVAAHLTTGGE